MDLIGPILVLFVVVAVLISAIVLPIVALVVSLNLRKRISQLEARIAQLGPAPTRQAAPPDLSGGPSEAPRDKTNH